jgi:thioesterase domain-containing protein
MLSVTDSRYIAAGNREEMLQRIEAYDRYLSSRTEQHKLACPIRLIHAGENTDPNCAFRISQEEWGALTGDFHTAAGAGPHVLMLDPPHVARNAALLADALKELAESAAARREETVAG